MGITILNCGAVHYHRLKTLIERHPVTPTVKQRAHRVRDVHLLGKYYKPLPRARPYDGLASIWVPRKNPVTIRIPQTPDGQVPTPRYRIVLANLLNPGKWHIFRISPPKISYHLLPTSSLQSRHPYAPRCQKRTPCPPSVYSA